MISGSWSTRPSSGTVLSLAGKPRPSVRIGDDPVAVGILIGSSYSHANKLRTGVQLDKTIDHFGR